MQPCLAAHCIANDKAQVQANCNSSIIRLISVRVLSSNRLRVVTRFFVVPNNNEMQK